MDQISPPVRIVAVVALLFAAAWFTMLKPSDEAAPVASAPAATATPAVDSTTHAANTATGRTVQAAKGAARTQEASDARSSGARSSGAPTRPVSPATKPEPITHAKPKPATPAKPGAVVAKATGLPRPVARAIARRQVLVLLFWNPRAADDRIVRQEVERANLHRDHVFVKVAPLRHVSRYVAITQGAEVEQSPSVVVVDRKLHAQLLPGYVDRQTIDQAVSDALRAK